MATKPSLKGLEIRISTLESNLLDTVNVLKDLRNKLEELDSEVDVMIDTMFGGGPSAKDQ